MCIIRSFSFFRNFPFHTRLSVCLYVCLFVCLSVCMSVCLSVCLPVCLLCLLTYINLPTNHQAETLDKIQSIGLTSLSRLKHLDKSDPAVRRLFTRPRVTQQETHSTTIDPDIKQVVDDFLKGNIMGNFIISR